ncbi:hypothetical protein HN587_06520 [Candidatus Woesearchaeota archaeon]|jgi:hypothetical protein|nr:hypothetical protein [Candidatus Woesearchaeota archaeon]
MINKKAMSQLLMLFGFLVAGAMALLFVFSFVMKGSSAASADLDGFFKNKPCAYSNWDLFDFRNAIVNSNSETCQREYDSELEIGPEYFDEFAACWEKGYIKYVEETDLNYVAYTQALTDIYCSTRSAYGRKIKTLKLEIERLEELDKKTTYEFAQLNEYAKKLDMYTKAYFVQSFGKSRKEVLAVDDCVGAGCGDFCTVMLQNSATKTKRGIGDNEGCSSMKRP